MGATAITLVRSEQVFYTGNEQMFGRRAPMELTDRQQAILESIRGALSSQGYPPTVREIAQDVGLSSPASVQSQLSILEAKGLIRRGTARRRALELVRSPEDALPPARSFSRLPLVGRVAAGTPLLADENIEEMIDVPGLLSHGEDDGFVLRVRGSSMVNAGILDGDIVVVRRQDTASNGEIVVALIGDDATLKRFFLEEGHVRLQPENDGMEPIITVDPRIVGKVVGVMRRL
jgi:repressor LexA